MAYKETRARLEALLQNKNALAAELRDAGTDSPATDSLPDLTADAREVVAPKGVKQTMTVSAGARVCRSEFVERVLEYAPAGEALRFALEDVHILDAAELSAGRVGVVFAQNGQTKFKLLVADKGTVALGNTLVLRETAVDYARLVELSEGGALVIYPADGVGYADKISLDGRVSALAWSDTWDGDDPQNACVAELSGGRLLLTALRNDGEAWAVIATENGSKNGLRLGDAVRLALDCDKDSYAGAWALCAVDGDSGALCFPRGDGQSLGVAVLEALDEAVTVNYAGHLTYKGALPAADCVALGRGKWLVAYGVSYQDTSAELTKSLLAAEVWGLTRHGAERLDYGCDDVRVGESLGGVAAENAGVGVAVSFSAETAGRCMYLAAVEGVTAGHGAPTEAHGGFCRVVPVTAREAICVVQRDGNGYGGLWTLAERVIPATRDFAHGIAVSGGAAGEEITVVVR